VTPESPTRSAAASTTRRRAKRRSPRTKFLLGLALLAAFGVGVALGQALHDNPRPGGVQTSFRTLPPLTQTRSTG
jgi:hypothetical protein